MYELYLGGILFPVAPEKITLKVKNRNKTVDLVDGGELNIIKAPGLTDISFSVLLPNVRYPFARYVSGYASAEYFLGVLEKIKSAGLVTRLVIIRRKPRGEVLYDTNIPVTLEDYKAYDDVKEGFDVTADISLKQYKSHAAGAVRIADNGDANIEESRDSDRQTPKTYTVKDGDCLWNIAKALYGDGTKYAEIYAANRDTIDGRNAKSGNSKYTIYTGQQFIIP